jgi:serine kinase of HPr protein (carbohydrate metabolism regulator)
MHAGCVARLTAGVWAGVLLRGPSGAGKSDLALRLLHQGWSLVGDDRVLVWRSGDELYARGAPPLAGLIEARGLDVLAGASRPLATVRLLVDCVQGGGTLERVSERGADTLSGVAVERVRLRPLEASAPIKVGLALQRAMTDPIRF